MPKQRDIVLLPVPFTDLTANRRRPVVVISNDDYHAATHDMIVVAMTSNPTATPHSFILQPSDLESGHLNRPGKVRVDKIYALSQSLAIKVFGTVNLKVLDLIRQTLGELLATR